MAKPDKTLDALKEQLDKLGKNDVSTDPYAWPDSYGVVFASAVIIQNRTTTTGPALNIGGQPYGIAKKSP